MNANTEKEEYNSKERAGKHEAKDEERRDTQNNPTMSKNVVALSFSLRARL